MHNARAFNTGFIAGGGGGGGGRGGIFIGMVRRFLDKLGRETRPVLHRRTLGLYQERMRSWLYV